MQYTDQFMKQNTKQLFSVILALFCAVFTVIFTVLCIANFRTGFIYRHAVVIVSVAVCAEILYIAFTAVFFLLNK